MEDLVVDENIVLKRDSEEQGVDWINVVQDINQWRTLTLHGN
jgi:hypothetical protein